MKKVFLKKYFGQWKAFMITLICIGTAFTSIHAADREIGGYVDRAEDRFVRNVWNFIKNFRAGKTLVLTVGRKFSIIGANHLNSTQTILIL